MPNVFKNVLTRQGGVDWYNVNGNYEPQYQFEPAVAGYFFAWIEHLPPISQTFLSNYDLVNVQDQQNAVATLIRSVTLGDWTLDITTWDGFLQIKTPGKIQQTTNITIRFIDSQYMSLTKFFRAWHQAIRPISYDIYSNATPGLVESYGSGYKAKYKANMVLFTTDPQVHTVTFAIALIGVWPVNVPLDIFTIDTGNVELYTFTQQLSVDFIFSDEELENRCQNLLSTLYVMDIYKKEQ